MRQIQAVLGEIAARAGTASENVGEQVEALRAVSEGAIREAAELVEALDLRGRTLSESTGDQLRSLTAATGVLEEVEARMSAALGQRHEALDGLVARVSERSGELDGVTRSFTSLIDDSLRTAEGKARQIGGVLANSAQATANVIAEQFERLRTTTAEERARTAAELRESYEAMLAEVNGAMASATARFRDATGDLRGMAGEIQRELESTRAELRRGILELPQETEETAANMRRVVADQIKALNELAALVTRSNRAVDVVTPAQAPRRVNEGGAYAADARPARGPAMTPRDEQRGGGGYGPPSPPRPAERSRPTRQDQADAPGEGRDGWLSDLLLRSSPDDAANGPPGGEPQPDSRLGAGDLDSIANDIARMIDHDAAVEVWDRYRQGERNVFTRRLYTVPGQQTFDEIRRKYRRDQDFRRTVDRYVEEFERLIGEVSRQDPDQALARTYLVSETGKVYTILAHASGRFE